MRRSAATQLGSRRNPSVLRVHAAADHLDVSPGPIFSGSIYQPSRRTIIWDVYWTTMVAEGSINHAHSLRWASTEKLKTTITLKNQSVELGKNASKSF
jgi:hypothetical protein